MKNIIVFIVCILIGNNVYSQFVYYGYPDSVKVLNKGDRVILNVPTHTDCRFNNIDEFEKIVNLLKNNEKDTLRIEVNYFYGDSTASNGCSEILCRQFKEILKLKTTLNNYKIINNGCRNPIFLSKDKGGIIYNLYNSRIEIIVE